MAVMELAPRHHQHHRAHPNHRRHVVPQVHRSHQTVRRTRYRRRHADAGAPSRSADRYSLLHQSCSLFAGDPGTSRRCVRARPHSHPKSTSPRSSSSPVARQPDASSAARSDDERTVPPTRLARAGNHAASVGKTDRWRDDQKEIAARRWRAAIRTVFPTGISRDVGGCRTVRGRPGRDRRGRAR